MGKKPVGDNPDSFASDLNAYFKHVVSVYTPATDGRWLADVTGNERGKGYWSGLLKGERAMNTNDIDVIARTFNVAPFEFVRYAHMFAAGEVPPELNVGDPVEDDDVLTPEQDQAIRQSDVELAALEGENEAENPRAD